MSIDAGYAAFRYQSQDGLTLGGRDYGAGQVATLPVVCLPGLTRTARDFDLLAHMLAEAGRRVLVFDYRGRGTSDRDPTGASYNPLVEMQDVLLGMSLRGVTRAIFVGTSRGGIITMLMGTVKRDAIAGVVLNDIGSIIETAGLFRIKSYVGQGEAPRDWDDAVRLIRTTHGRFFPGYSDQDWIDQARLTFAEQDGRPVVDYDPALARGLDAVTPETPPVDLTAAFATLTTVPVMVIRGEETDLLSRATLDAMAATHPGLVAVNVAGEGHPPMLRGPLLSRIAGFIATIG
ncbi:alpha/beta hydrolase [Kaistia dalseonensis]|uniref:Pimeloyl-ACP methyl ester carboxylesterase n=1 Tax=Kaistia dalseonensis TaxID=410840 RepID=A0ABU0H3N0_9HYPH|nr:alpha/beta hydrolase [Kaistia dalseonensis]MCX5493564.1 alpha/beta hydrolase [Kaistia dalseonensis]MDQ0436124.1 pimeloyl-ACP methyl ester carboxylesterase [Kaistia dalseonensis]